MVSFDKHLNRKKYQALVLSFSFVNECFCFVNIINCSYGTSKLNPLRHIDGMGFIWFLLIGVGWAKPVQINPLKFKKYKSFIEYFT